MRRFGKFLGVVLVAGIAGMVIIMMTESAPAGLVVALLIYAVCY